MRIDKFLKASRIIKRRTLAQDAASEGHIFINDKACKPSKEVKVGDLVMIDYSKKQVVFKVLSTDPPRPKMEDQMYEIINIIEK